MSSIPRCEAASISTTSIEVPFVIETHALQVLSGVAVGPVLAVQRLREDPRHRGLAGAARPGEEVGLAHLPAGDRVLQRPDDRVLPDHLVEVLGPVLPVERRHFLDSSRIDPGFPVIVALRDPVRGRRRTAPPRSGAD